jgi:hypothetical protein
LMPRRLELVRARAWLVSMRAQRSAGMPTKVRSASSRREPASHA